MSGHLIVVGYDTWTDAVIELLRSSKISYSILLTDKEAAENLRSEGEEIVCVSDFNEQAFRDAGIDRADAVLVATLDDQQNILAVLTATDIDETMTVGTFTSRERDGPKLRRAGADVIVNLGQAVAELIAETALTGAEPQQLLEEILSEETIVELAQPAQVTGEETESHEQSDAGLENDTATRR